MAGYRKKADPQLDLLSFGSVVDPLLTQTAMMVTVRNTSQCWQMISVSLVAN